MSTLDAALAYLKEGFSVLPVEPNGKKPLVKWEAFQSVLATPDMAALWIRQWPDMNLGIATGELSGLTVVDIDGPEGAASVKEYGLKFPRTRTIKTPKGWHLYYFFNPVLHTGAGFVPHVDIRSTGGYVVAPPSVVNAKTYTVLRDEAIAELNPIPPELLGHVNKPTTGASDNERERWIVTTLMGGKPEGERNANAARLVGYFHHKGLPSDVIKALVTPFCERCDPPMDELELQAVIDSVTHYQTGELPYGATLPL